MSYFQYLTKMSGFLQKTSIATQCRSTVSRPQLNVRTMYACTSLLIAKI